MGVASGLTTLVNGNTSDASEVNGNFTILKNSVNNIVADQITDTVITSAKIASTGILLAKIRGGATTDETLANAMENYIEGCYIYRVDGDNIGVTTGSVMINGQLRRISSAKTDLSVPSMASGDWVAVWLLADSGNTIPEYSAVDTNSATPATGSNPGTNGRCIGAIKYVDGTTKISSVRQFRSDHILGWDYMAGDNTRLPNSTITYGVTFTTAPFPFTSVMGYTTSVPTSPASFDTRHNQAGIYEAEDPTTTAFLWQIDGENGVTYSSSNYYGISFMAHGRYS